MHVPWIRLAIAVCFSMLTVPAVSSQQPSCDVACRVNPFTAPASCACGEAASEPGAEAEPAVQPTKSAAPEPADARAREVLEAEHAAVLREISAVDNYWIVEISTLTPTPAVRYYEKTQLDGRVVFTLVPSVAPAQLEAAEDTSLILEALVGGFGTIDPAGPDPSGPAEPAVDVASGGASGSTAFPAALDELTRDLWMLGPGGQSAVTHRGVGAYFPDRATPEERLISVGPDDEWPDGAMRCVRSIIDQRVVWRAPDGSVRTIEYAERWTTSIEDSAAPSPGPRRVAVYLRIDGYMATPAGVERAVIERETDKFARHGPLLLPQRVRERFSETLIGFEKRIEFGGLNQGPPSAREREAIVGSMAAPAATPAGL